MLEKKHSSRVWFPSSLRSGREIVLLIRSSPDFSKHVKKIQPHFICDQKRRFRKEKIRVKLSRKRNEMSSWCKRFAELSSFHPCRKMCSRKNNNIHLQNETFADVKCVTVNSTISADLLTLTRVILVKAVTHPWNRFFFWSDSRSVTSLQPLLQTLNCSRDHEDVTSV